MRILHCYKTFFPETIGGVPQVISALAKGMEKRCDSAVLIARLRGRRRRYLSDSIPVEAVTSFGSLLSMPVAPSFPFVLSARARHCELLALHMPFPLNDLGLAVGVPAKAAVVVHWHSEIVGQKHLVPVVAPFIRRTLVRAQRVVVSDRSAVDGSDFLRPHAEKCVVIPFGIDVGYWQTLAPAHRRRVDDLKARYPRLVVASGRMVRYKGFETLIEAVSRADAQLVIVGDGPLRPTLDAAARRHGLNDRLALPGHVTRDELKNYLHAAKVFAFPSVSAAETFGIAQTEAMAVGLPIVNTALPTGVPNVARHNIEALTVSPGDAEALSAALSRVLDDCALAVRLGEAGRARANDEYAETKFISRVEDVYAQAIAEARHANR